MSEPTWYDATKPTLVTAGSLILCDSPDLIGKAIRVGEWLKWRGGCRWNHCAIAVETSANPLVVQASVDGVTGDRRLNTLEGGPVMIVPLPRGYTVNDVVEFAKMQVGLEYGYLTLLGIVIDQLSPRWLRFQPGRWGTWICSALAAECWRVGGWKHDWPSIYAVAPAELALAVGVDPTLVYR